MQERELNAILEVYVWGPMLFGLVPTQVTDICFPIKAKKKR